jgi:hypothetical protein
VEHEHQDTYDETFYTIYSFLNDCRRETRNKLLNDLTRRETQEELTTDLTSQLRVQYSRELVTSRLFGGLCGGYVIAN